MARKIGLSFLGLGTIFFAFMMGVQLYNSSFDMGAVDIRLFIAFLSGVITIGRMLFGLPQHTVSAETLEKEYEDILKNVFQYEPKLRKKLLQAISLYNKNKYRSAIYMLNILLKSCGTNCDIATVNFFLALCYDDQNLQAQAIEHYLQAITYSPTNDTAFSNLGLIYKKMGNFQDAIDCYKKAVAINPNNFFAHNNIAIIHLDMMEADEAIKSAVEALEIKPNMYQAMNTLAMAFSLKTDKVSAEKYFQQSVLNGCPNAVALRAMMNNIATKAQETQGKTSDD